VAGGYEAAVVRITTRAGEERARELAEALDEAFATVEADGTVEATVTSEGIVVDEVKRALSESQAQSLVVTLAAAMSLLVVAFWWEARRPFLGVITILPVAFVVLWTYGMMAVTGIPFSPTTAMVAALAIGIGVDYTIHMVRRYLEDRTRFSTLGEAVRSTARNTGAALGGSALTTLAGFGILVTSSLGPFRELGAVVVFAIGFSLFAAVVTLPAMLVLWDRWHVRRDRDALAHLDRGGTAVSGAASRGEPG
jgi:predicted RND superfamily exporter protein